MLLTFGFRLDYISSGTLGNFGLPRFMSDDKLDPSLACHAHFALSRNVHSPMTRDSTHGLHVASMHHCWGITQPLPLGNWSVSLLGGKAAIAVRLTSEMTQFQKRASDIWNEMGGKYGILREGKNKAGVAMSAAGEPGDVSVLGAAAWRKRTGRDAPGSQKPSSEFCDCAVGAWSEGLSGSFLGTPWPPFSTCFSE